MWRLVPVSIALLLLAGCGSQTPKGGVSGTVTYKNQPVNGPTLFLYPTTAGQGAEMTIPVGQDGTFKSEVPVGDYKVVVQPNPGGAAFNTKGMKPDQLEKMKEQIEASKIPATIHIPPKYTKKDSTDWTMTVGKGEQTVTFELKD
jgi:hypothetical protein